MHKRIIKVANLMLNNKVLMLLVIMSLTIPQYIYGSGKIAQSKMQFIKIGAGGRPTAMGDAYTAQEGDPFCMLYNPAGIAYVKSSGFSVNMTNWIADINHMVFLITFVTDRFGVFGVNAISMDYGTMARTIVDEHNWHGYETLGDFTISEYALGASYANKVTDRVSLGGQVKYFYQNLGDVTVWRFPGTALEEEETLTNIDQFLAYDFGTFYKTGYKEMQIGMSIQNFANRAIPLTFRFGVSMNLAELINSERKSYKVILAVDALHPRDYEERIHLGMEYSYKNKMYLRSGYKFNYDEEGLTLGAGVNLEIKQKILKLEYSYTDFNRLGNVSRYSLGFTF